MNKNDNEGLKKFNVYWNIISTVTHTVYAKDYHDAREKVEANGLSKKDLANAEIIKATPICAENAESGEVLDFCI